MERIRLPARKAVRQGVSSAGEEPACTRPTKAAHQSRGLAAPDPRGGGTLQGRRARLADANGKRTEKGGRSVSLGQIHPQNPFGSVVVSHLVTRSTNARWPETFGNPAQKAHAQRSARDDHRA